MEVDVRVSRKDVAKLLSERGVIPLEQIPLAADPTANSGCERIHYYITRIVIIKWHTEETEDDSSVNARRSWSMDMRRD